MLMMPRNRPSTDQGFPLIELLIAVPVSVMILSALVGTFIAMTGSSNATSQRVSDASIGQQLAVLLPADLQSTFPNKIDTAPGTPPGCATPLGANVGTNVVTLTWDQALPTATRFVASYRLLTDTPTTQGVAQKKLMRYFCSGPNPSTVQASIRPVATGLSAATATVGGGV